MEVSKHLKSFQGIFLEEKIQKQLIGLQKDGYVENMHIIFKSGNIEEYPKELMEKEFKIKIIGYISDEKKWWFFSRNSRRVKKIL